MVTSPHAQAFARTVLHPEAVRRLTAQLLRTYAGLLRYPVRRDPAATSFEQLRQAAARERGDGAKGGGRGFR